MSDEGYSTSFSYLLLAGTAAFCLRKYNCDICTLKLACGSFSLVLLNSLLGAICWGNTAGKQVVEKTYQFTTTLKTIFVLPFIVTQVWLDYGYEWELSSFYSMLCLIPFHLFLANKTNESVTDIVVAINVTALGIVAFMNNSLHGLAAAGLYTCTHFLFRPGHFDFDESSLTDMQNYSMVCFTYYALMCLMKQDKCS